MSAVLAAEGLGKRYGRHWALSDCTLEIPSGCVAGLVGPNGAGKTTLLHLGVGLLSPTSGSIEVLGGQPAGEPAQLARVGFVAQDTPTYPHLTVADHLQLGARLNPGWDRGLAERRIARLGLDPRQRAGRLSGGQRAQLALTLAWPSDRSYCCSTSRWPASTPWLGASFSKVSWKSSPSTASASCSRPT